MTVAAPFGPAEREGVRGGRTSRRRCTDEPKAAVVVGAEHRHGRRHLEHGTIAGHGADHDAAPDGPGAGRHR